MSEAAASGATQGPTNTAEGEIADLLRLADQCVKCGYCLPHCPTFKLANDEGESPRGRIALIQGWLTGAIDDGPRVQLHLDQCLECRACEPACPSLVRYGALMDGARALRERRRSPPDRWLQRARLNLLTQPAGLRLVAAVGIAYRWLHLPVRLVERASRGWPAVRVLDPLARSLRWPREPTYAGVQDGETPAAPATFATTRTSAGTGVATITPALFRGCVAQLTDQPLEAAALKVLARLGCSAEIPPEQVCCGAIHRHNGYPADADRQVAINDRVLADRPVIGLASACVAELREQGRLQAFEICRFLLDRPWPTDVSLQPLSATVAVHEPCSHCNQLRDQAAVYQLLRRIPRLSVIPLPGNDTCCGAAGTYLTKHPNIALSLAAPKIEALRQLCPDFLVTTNTGCALHLAACARSAGLETRVMHPIQLIERQLSLHPQATQ